MESEEKHEKTPTIVDDLVKDESHDSSGDERMAVIMQNSRFVVGDQGHVVLKRGN